MWLEPSVVSVKESCYALSLFTFRPIPLLLLETSAHLLLLLPLQRSLQLNSGPVKLLTLLFPGLPTLG